METYRVESVNRFPVRPSGSPFAGVHLSKGTKLLSAPVFHPKVTEFRPGIPTILILEGALRGNRRRVVM